MLTKYGRIDSTACTGSDGSGEYNMQPAFEAIAVNAMHRGDAILIGLVV